MKNQQSPVVLHPPETHALFPSTEGMCASPSRLVDMALILLIRPASSEDSGRFYMAATLSPFGRYVLTETGNETRTTHLWVLNDQKQGEMSETESDDD